MQATVKKSDSKIKNKDKSKEETSSLSNKIQDDKSRKNHTVSTPRNYIQKSTAADIYVQKKKTNVQVTTAPKKSLGSSTGNDVSPMKGLLKASSTASVISSSRDNKKHSMVKTSLESAKKLSAKKETRSSARISSTKDAKVPTDSTRKSLRTAKNLPFVNVTVNSPIVKRKLEYETSKRDEMSQKDNRQHGNAVKKEKENTKEIETRQRTKTRTLAEDEVKILTHEAVDNNAEMLNLSRKLAAKPKAFYINFEAESSKKAVTAKNDKSSDEDVSYEDDFESYESDFESYHTESQNGSNGDDAEQMDDEDDEEEDREMTQDADGRTSNSREVRDEEKMLDSGNFDLREQRSAQRKPDVMDFIQEAAEDLSDDKKISLTDEGFQEMSSSSAVSSMKSVHVDILDKPLFIDFTKSKENRRKRKIFEKMKQRAQDILSMITLHEMSFTLFEMKPIPYDLYMATFGRSNYTQSAVQTFDDGIAEEVQTEEVLSENKWTQHPVEFSKEDIYLSDINKKYTQNNEDYLSKFTFLLNKKTDEDINNEINQDFNYKSNPLRIYLEQKNGVGAAEMLPYSEYQSKLKNKNFNVEKLRRFLKRIEGRTNHILSLNVGDKIFSDLVKSSKLPFSKGYVSISLKNISDENFTFLKNAKVYKVVTSDTKCNLLMTAHKKLSTGFAAEKSVICLWDLNVASKEPIKLLVAIDHITIARFRGNTDGYLVAALEDSSIHLWDLSEEPTWRDDVASTEKTTNIVEINSESLSQSERDREWNVKNNKVNDEPTSFLRSPLQVSAYTSSAGNMDSKIIDDTVGLELIDNATANQDGGRRVIGQVCSLQRIGILTTWNIIQEKSKTLPDIGKAFWSKMKLEKCRNINLTEYIDTSEKFVDNTISSFNLNAAKKRLATKKQEKRILKRENSAKSRSKSSLSSELEFDRPTSTAVRTNRLPEKNILSICESGIVCNDLKIIKINKNDNYYLIAKNCGEVLSCRRNAGVVKVKTFSVVNDTSSVTCIEVSPHGLPYFLAATDSGTVHLYSVFDARVLLTLDCRNGPPTSELVDKYETDQKGRFISSTPVRASKSYTHDYESNKLQKKSNRHEHVIILCNNTPKKVTYLNVSGRFSIASMVWSRTNPCNIFTLSHKGTVHVWQLTQSDINATCVRENAVTTWSSSDNNLAVVTPDGEVQLHRLTHERRNSEYLNLFQKYVSLL